MTAVSSASNFFLHRIPWRLIFKIFTAFVGGYLLANAIPIFLAKAFPDLKAFMVAYGFIFAFLYWALAVMWVFHWRSLWRSCGSIWIVTIILALSSWGLTIMSTNA